MERAHSKRCEKFLNGVDVELSFYSLVCSFLGGFISIVRVIVTFIVKFVEFICFSIILLCSVAILLCLFAFHFNICLHFSRLLFSFVILDS